jgi:hypothetical protein
MAGHASAQAPGFPAGFAQYNTIGTVVSMWDRKTPVVQASEAEQPHPLKDALRTARIESAERTGNVVDLHDAEVARLELVNEALDPIFAELPPEADLFDRGISRGDPPRLWLDAIAHIVMGGDKREYRFVQDTRYGRKVLAESADVSVIVAAVTKYLAQRLIERERALASAPLDPRRATGFVRRRRRSVVWAFLLGMLASVAILVVAALLSAPR